MPLSLERVTVRYGAVEAVKAVSLEAHKAECISVIGINGAGKSSLVYAIAGFTPYDGRVMFKGQSLEGVPSHARMKRGLAICTETRDLFGDLSVKENLRLGGFAMREQRDIDKNLMGIWELFPQLQQRRNQIAATLSGGEQQMLALGRSLMMSPELLVLDEPTLGLAPIVIEAIGGALREILLRGLSVILMEQNATFGFKQASHLYVMDRGSIVLSGTSEELMKRDSIVEMFLGVSKVYDHSQ